MHLWTRIAGLVAAVGFAGCSPAPVDPLHPELALKLRWVAGYPGENRRKVETGLLWGLSFLGAALPAGHSPFHWQGDELTLDLDAAGVLPESRDAWVRLVAVLKASDEYRRTGAVDIGRFLVLTLCSSHQYFALTGAAGSLETFRRRHPAAVQSAAVVESDIAHGNRLLEFGPGGDLERNFVVAYEGRGSLARGDFERAEIETVDFMPNGQLRFGLYDLDGHLKPAASAQLTDAAKPSKCLWCHEIRLQPPFNNVTSVSGFPSATDLKTLIAERMQEVANYRSTLRSQVDYGRTNDHTFAELLYLSFNEPSAERLAAEWHVPLAQLRERLAPFRTHRNAEFAFLGGQLYERAQIDRLAPYPTLPVPTQIREVSAFEPTLLGEAAAADPAP